MNVISYISGSARRRFDADALNYIERVQTQDGQGLEPRVKVAMHNLFYSLKNTSSLDVSVSNWTAMQSFNLLAGPRSLGGITRPCKTTGVTPTLINFVTGDLNRKTGLKGNGANRVWNFNFSNNYPGTNNTDGGMGAYLTEPPSAGSIRAIINGTADGTTGGASDRISITMLADTTILFRAWHALISSVADANRAGLYAVTKNGSSSANVSHRGDTLGTYTQSTSARTASNVLAFATNSSGTGQPSDMRSALFYAGRRIDGEDIKAIMDTYIDELNLAI